MENLKEIGLLVISLIGAISGIGAIINQRKALLIQAKKEKLELENQQKKTDSDAALTTVW